MNRIRPVFSWVILVVSILLISTACDPPLTGTQNPNPQPVGRFIAVGTGGTVIYSDDFGATFTPVTSKTSETLRDVASDGQGHCVAVGYDGTAIYSDDHGLTWNNGSGMDPIIMNAVTSYGTSKFVAVGEVTGSYYYGIYRSTDGGATWSETATTVILKGVGIRSSTDFVAVGNDAIGDAALYLTYNGGDGWTLYGTGSGIPDGTKRPYEVTGTQSGYFVAVGEFGSLYSNNGASWSAGGSIPGVVYGVSWSGIPGRLVAVGVGSGGGISKGRVFYSPSMMGTSWTEVDVGALTEEIFFDVATDGNGRYVVAGDAGAVIHSVDTGNLSESGEYWVSGDSGVSTALYGIGFVALP